MQKKKNIWNILSKLTDLVGKQPLPGGNVDWRRARYLSGQWVGFFPPLDLAAASVVLSADLLPERLEKVEEDLGLPFLG